MRIFDRISSGENVVDVVDPYAAVKTATLRKAVHQTPRLIADEASQYIWLHHKDQWNPSDDFGDLHPPFEMTWVEWQTPAQQMRGGRMMEWPATRWAVLMSPSSEDGVRYFGIGFVTQSKRDAIHSSPIYPVILDDWSVTLKYSPEHTISWAHSARYLEDCDDAETVAHGFGYEFLAMYLAFGWLNSRTFETELHGPSARVERKRLKRNHFSGLDYHQIVIGKKHRKRWESASGVTAQRFHHVRGHFADYRERGLFGKPEMRGVFWVPGHARGDKSLGTINHEYHITAEAAQ